MVPKETHDIATVLTAGLRRRLADGESVDEALPGGGRLYVDRALPFVCVFRHPPGGADGLAERLVTTQASYLTLASGAGADEAAAAVVGLLAERHDAFLVVEVWSAPEQDACDDPGSLRPCFHVAAPEDAATDGTVAALGKALQRVVAHKQIAEVTVDCVEAPAPPGRASLSGRCAAPGCTVVGIEVSPVYRQAETGRVFPFLFDELRRAMGEALKKAFFHFASARTAFEAPHYRALGRRRLEPVAREVDRSLADLDASFQFLLQMTPVNAGAAQEAFEAGGCEEEPVFRYRPLSVDPELIKRRLFALPIERVEDPALAWLFREKQEELDRKVTMLRDRDTRQFFFGSLQLYGEVQPALLALAEEILERLPLHDYDFDAQEHFDAQDFASLAAAEFAHYRKQLPSFPRTAQIRTDLPPGLMVSSGELLIGRRTKIPQGRAEALLQHEVGTHMLTYFNGRAQPLRLLGTGLAGYEALQEGLAVLAEYLVGGLTIPRLRVLAARVVAAQCVIDGTPFVEVYRQLRRGHAFEHNEAFSIAMRTFRGGGLIKDVIYLRGLQELLGHLREGGDLEPLLVGKIALHHRPLLEELAHRGVLRPPPLRPRYLDHPAAVQRLDRIRSGLTFIDLVHARRPHQHEPNA